MGLDIGVYEYRDGKYIGHPATFRWGGRYVGEREF